MIEVSNNFHNPFFSCGEDWLNREGLVKHTPQPPETRDMRRYYLPRKFSFVKIHRKTWYQKRMRQDHLLETQ